MSICFTFGGHLGEVWRPKDFFGDCPLWISLSNCQSKECSREWFKEIFEQCPKDSLQGFCLRHSLRKLMRLVCRICPPEKVLQGIVLGTLWGILKRMCLNMSLDNFWKGLFNTLRSVLVNCSRGSSRKYPRNCLRNLRISLRKYPRDFRRHFSHDFSLREFP